MRDYINRRQAIQAVRQYLHTAIDKVIREEEYEFSVVDFGVEICNLLANIPAADAAEVLHCDECMYSKGSKNRTICMRFGCDVNDNGFCGCGKKGDTDD